MKEIFHRAIYELIKQTATVLPEDVVDAIKQARQCEQEGSIAEVILSRYLENIELAAQRKAPICQDTGFPIFYVFVPSFSDALIPPQEIKATIYKCIERATYEQLLRPNAVDPISGKNSGNNIGKGFPAIYFKEDNSLKHLEIALILKGGGSENVSCQYSLPYKHLNAGRDIEGIRKVVLDAVVKAEGKGCPPGILGICIGGDREGGFREAKRQFLRPLNDVNSDEELKRLEETLLRDINTLGIGPQGLGGKTTVLAVKIGVLHRLPASYYVTISYMCWAMRRRRLIFRDFQDFEII